MINLGGTTPLDIIIKFPISKIDNSENEDEDWDDMGEDDDEKYWFTKDKIDKIDKVHKYLETFLQLVKFYLFLQL